MRGTNAVTHGRVTIPSEEGFAERTRQIAQLWGADAVRNSDGTELDADVTALGKRVYRTYFPARGNNAFIRDRMEQCPQIYLMSERVVAAGSDPLRIEVMRRYFAEQLRPNLDDDPSRYWEVIDRTTGRVVPPSQWNVDQSAVVTVERPEAFHEYTVSFLAYIIWDPVGMYNHLTNGWKDKDHEIPYDIRHPETWEFVRSNFKKWLDAHPEIDVVRFTSFFYQFLLVFDEQAREKLVDWCGYGATVSAAALAEFERVKGYALRPEDFVDEGYYNSSARVPNQRYLDYIDFVCEPVTQAAAELVRMAHDAGKEAMMFLGDQWIGTEPYGDRFASIGLDAVVGSVGDGTTLRMISDIPGVRYTEGRFLPYLFPDTFREGNDPSIEAREVWLRARRAMLRSPIDRMGYGGYLSLANRFPGFIDTVAEIAQEFRDIHDHIRGSAPYSGLRVALLDSWGKLRSWQAFTVAHAVPYKQTYSFYGVLEALSGMAVDVEFLSFDDVISHGIDPSIDVIVNCGAHGTAFSGGHRWRDPRLVTAVRSWVADGGGIVGVGEPSATPYQGRYFQLADCFGVERELSQSLSVDKYHHGITTDHFVIADQIAPFDFGESTSDVYALDEQTQVLEYTNGEVHAAARSAGRGRAVYLAGLPFSTHNTRLLLRSLYWAAGREADLTMWFATNPECEVSYYPSAGVYCVANVSDRSQTTTVHLAGDETATVQLGPHGLVWGDVS